LGATLRQTEIHMLAIRCVPGVGQRVAARQLRLRSLMTNEPGVGQGTLSANVGIAASSPC
jgi:hypothetical protein